MYFSYCTSFVTHTNTQSVFQVDYLKRKNLCDENWISRVSFIRIVFFLCQRRYSDTNFPNGNLKNSLCPVYRSWNIYTRQNCAPRQRESMIRSFCVKENLCAFVDTKTRLGKWPDSVWLKGTRSLFYLSPFVVIFHGAVSLIDFKTTRSTCTESVCEKQRFVSSASEYRDELMNSVPMKCIDIRGGTGIAHFKRWIVLNKCTWCETWYMTKVCFKW